MKLSNKILIAAFSLLLILTFITMFKVRSIHMEYSQNETLGNKNWVTAEFPLQEFTQLKVGDHFEVNWHKGAPMVKVKIEENLKPFFRAKQEGQRVEIRFDSLSNYQLHGKIIVDVFSQTLDLIKLEDFVRFSIEDTITSKEFKIEMEDHCEANVLLNAEILDIHLYDFCDLNMIGRVKEATIKIKDHSNLDAEHLDIVNAKVDMEDFANASISVRNHMKAECVDHSNLEYRGDSVITEIIQRDFSDVSKPK